jgi:hypothetical protein
VGEGFTCEEQHVRARRVGRGVIDDDSEPVAAEPLPELCDRCGVVISGGSEAYAALVLDSSVVHAHDPKLYGQRVLTACGHVRWSGVFSTR